MPDNFILVIKNEDGDIVFSYNTNKNLMLELRHLK